VAWRGWATGGRRSQAGAAPLPVAMRATRVAEHIRDLGILLTAEAVQALEEIREDYALELVEAVKAKADAGHIKNPSNYICATIARGYVPEADGGAVTAMSRTGSQQAEIPMASEAPFITHAGEKRKAPVYVPPPRKRGFEIDRAVDEHHNAEFDPDAAEQLAASRGMQRAHESGLELTEEAAKALLQLQPEHASELLETVVDKHATLRNPSNYIVATVARGFVPRVEQVAMATGSSSASLSAPGHIPAVLMQNGPMSLVPSDVTPVESRVLELNAQAVLERPLSAETLLALRCVDEGSALQLLSSLEAKGRGKGNVIIQNPNNYVQAAVVKIKKGLAEQGPAFDGGSPSSRREHFSPAPAARRAADDPNPSRQRAHELNLELDEQALELIGKIPVEECHWLLEAAAWIQAQNEDPSEHVMEEGQKLLDALEANAPRRRRRF